ncbi:MAG TPA: DUF523 domain-containing protein [Vicinamibacteria bacterium]|nr:DUF523 domain-containing protein [Vicinamibacteria bacterium]
MIKVLVSSCLLGEKVRYHGEDALCESDVLDRWRAEGRLVPFCPETAAGLPVPRPPAEIEGGDGHAVLEGKAFVSDSTGADVTAPFMKGARAALEAASSHGARLAVLKDGSPSCGSSYIFDGTFRGQRDSGQGLTAAILSRAGIRVFNERELEEAARHLELLEAKQREG